MDLKLGSKTVEFKPMTWGTQKKVFKLITKGIAQMGQVQEMATHLVQAVMAEKQPDFNGLSDVVAEIPELVTDVLALGLEVEKTDLDAATGAEVTTAIETFIDQNDLAEQWMRTKKAFAPFRQGQPAKAEKLEHQPV